MSPFSFYSVGAQTRQVSFSRQLVSRQPRDGPRILAGCFIMFSTLLRVWQFSFFGSPIKLIFKRGDLGSRLRLIHFNILHQRGLLGITGNHFTQGFHFYLSQRLPLGPQNSHGHFTTHKTIFPFPNGLCPTVNNGLSVWHSLTQVSELIVQLFRKFTEHFHYYLTFE